MTEKQTEALEKLNRGIQESRQEVQQRTMSLAQDYFDDSAEELKQQIKESRATLEGLPDQVPGGREEVFQVMFQELMDNYSAMEECIGEAQKNVADLDPDKIRRQGEVDATDAARRDAREFGIDLTEVEGTGSDGRVTVDDVKDVAETMEDGAAGQAAGQATGQAGQVAGQAQEAAGGASQQAQDTAGQAAGQAQQAAGQAQQAAGQATGQAGQVAGQATDVLGQAAGQAGQVAEPDGGQGGAANSEIDATDAARREAEKRGIDLSKVQGTGSDGRIVIWDVAERPDENAEGGGVDPADKLKNETTDAAAAGRQTTDQARQKTGQAAGQAAGQAGQVAGQASGALGGITDQVGQAAGGAAQQAQQAAGQATDQAQSAAGQGAGGDEAEEPKITNAARRKAEEMGVDPSKVKGSGSGGLITIKDVMGS